MLRERLNKALKEATLAKDACATATIRLILAALKDRDISARGKDGGGEISDDQILGLFQTMIKQRRDSIDMYVKGNRQDLADRERNEIDVIQRFMPEQMSDEAVSEAVGAVIDELGAGSLKEMGKVMAALRARYAGRMDFAKASAVAKQRLA
jgi:uncharacterized protein YqeY